jgi:hypothetical protein
MTQVRILPGTCHFSGASVRPTVLVLLVSFIALTGLFAAQRAVASDSCRLKAALISKTTGLVPGKRNWNNFIPLKHLDGTYAAQLNCAGATGMSMHFLSTGNPSPGWYRKTASGAAVLTHLQSAVILDGINRCVGKARKAPDEVASVKEEKVTVLCRLESYDNAVVLWIPERPH